MGGGPLSPNTSFNTSAAAAAAAAAAVAAVSNSTPTTGSGGEPLQRTACLACRKRKIKCDKKYPCTACSQSGIQCGFMLANRTKSRSKILHHLRKAPVEEQIEMSRQTGAGWGTNQLDLKLLSPNLIYHCVKAFFEQCFPINIIYDLTAFNTMVAGYQDSPKKYSLLAALCAVSIYQCTSPEILHTETGDLNVVAMSSRLLRASIKARSFFDYVQEPDLETVLTSFYLSVARFQLARDTKGWFYLRESCSFVQMLGLHREETYKTEFFNDSVTINPTAQRWRLLYYLMSISERACCIHRNVPVTLDHSIAFPQLDLTDPLQRGFQILNSLFTPFDRIYTGYRDSGHLPYSDPDAYVLGLHRAVTDACPPWAYFKNFPKPFPEAMVADLLVNQQWLLIKIYHLALQHALLTYLPQDADLGLLYPIKVARDLLENLEFLGGESFEVHGHSMLEKFYDIASTLADLIHVVPVPPSSPAISSSGTSAHSFHGFGPQDLLQALIKLVSQLRKEHNPYLPMLMEKVHSLIKVTPDFRRGSGSDSPFDQPISSATLTSHPQGYNDQGIPPSMTQYSPRMSNSMPGAMAEGPPLQQHRGPLSNGGGGPGSSSMHMATGGVQMIGPSQPPMTSGGGGGGGDGVLSSASSAGVVIPSNDNPSGRSTPGPPNSATGSVGGVTMRAHGQRTQSRIRHENQHHAVRSARQGFYNTLSCQFDDLFTMFGTNNAESVASSHEQ